MNSERWAQLEELFHRAAECDPRERARLLDEACRDDLALRGEVEALLANEENASRDMRAAVDGELHNATFTLVGETVSHYRILEGLGGGGMGLVYRAEDLRLGREVALKFLPEELAQDPLALKRLEQEARAASALNHPNVCTIHEIAEHGGRPFIVMEFLEGETLREKISGQKSGQQRLTLARQIDLAIQISDALAAAHARGIIHRDIKPANIFVTRSGVAKVLDFGVAKLSQGLGADEDRRIRRASGELRAPDEIDRLPTAPADNLSLTRTGVTLGTAGYMSPEQVRGEALDARTDLFSFGLVLYEMATGRAAFAVATAALTREAILHREPTPARELNPAIPKELAQIIRKALEKDRDQRYPSAADICVDLERLRQQVVRMPWARRRALAVGGVALAALAAPIVWLGWQRPAVTEWRDAKLQQLTANSWEDPVSMSAISPDGRHLAYIDGKGMHIKLVGADDSQLVPPPEGQGQEKIAWELVPSAWFPDSRGFLATSHPATEESVSWSPPTSNIWVISVSGGAPVKLRDAAMAWAVSPDGAWISFGSGKGPLGARELWMMGSDGTQARKVVEVDDARTVCCMYFLTGTRFAYILGDRSGDTLMARDLNSGRLTTLLSPSALRRMGDGALLPDGRLVYADPCAFQRFGTPCELWIERLDIYSGRLTQSAQRLTSAMGAELAGVSATPDGRLVAFQRTTSQETAYVAELQPGATGIHGLRHFTLEEGDDAIVDWTPDSQTAIIVRNRGDHSAVYKQALHSDVAEPIVARIESAAAINALVSADGKWLTVQLWPLPPPRDNAPRMQLWRVPISGGPLQKLFSMAPGSRFDCARAPVNLCVIGEPSADRRQVIVSAFDPITGLRGKELLRFDRYPNPNEDAPPLAVALSPDGQWLTTSATPSGPLRILSLRGAPARVVPITGFNAKGRVIWTADGRELIVAGVANKEAVLMRVDLRGDAHALLRCESAAECFVIPSPDGRMLGVNQTRLQTNVWMLQNF